MTNPLEAFRNVNMPKTNPLSGFDFDFDTPLPPTPQTFGRDGWGNVIQTNNSEAVMIKFDSISGLLSFGFGVVLAIFMAWVIWVAVAKNLKSIWSKLAIYSLYFAFIYQALDSSILFTIS